MSKIPTAEQYAQFMSDFEQEMYGERRPMDFYLDAARKCLADKDFINRISNFYRDEEELSRYEAEIRAKDPQFDLRVEFDNMLMRPIESFSELEMKRYNELKSILEPPNINGNNN